MEPNDIIIKTEGLSRVYRKRVKAEGLSGSIKGLFRKNEIRVQAVSSFDLEVKRGEIVGLIGPNGAGKTTIIKMLTGIIRPTEGTASVLGFRPYDRKEAFLSRMALVAGQKRTLVGPSRAGFLPAQPSHLPHPGKTFQGNPRAPFRGLRRGRPARFAGTRPIPGRTDENGILGALLHKPDILFLDEPTIGLDAPSQKRIREFLARENKERGVTVILTSHYMEDIRRLCPRTVVISRGAKTYDGGTELMFAQAREHRLIRLALASEAVWDPRLLPDAELIEADPGHFLIRVKPEALRPALPLLFSAYDVSDLSIEEEEMADSMEKIYRKGAERE